MQYLQFDASKKLDLILLGRVAIDFNPAYSDTVKEEFGPLKDVHYFEKFVGGSPANIACGVTRHGMKAGFIGKVSDDQFGDYVTDYFNRKGINTSHITRCKNGEKLGLTFTEMLSPKESYILMYRNMAADLQLSVEDIDEDYIASAKALLISGTSLAESPSREAAIKAAMLARKNNVPLIFDIDYREYNWKTQDDISIYYSIIAKEADIIMGSREEFDLTERLLDGRTRFSCRHQTRHEGLHRLYDRPPKLFHQTLSRQRTKRLRRRGRLRLRLPLWSLSGLGYHRLLRVRIGRGFHDGQKQ